MVTHSSVACGGEAMVLSQFVLGATLGWEGYSIEAVRFLE